MKYTLLMENHTVVKSTPNNKAYSLLELYIALGVIAAIFMAAQASFLNIIAKAKKNHSLNSIANMIIFSRQYAMAKQKTVYLCPSKNFKNCSFNWNDGAILFDKNYKVIKSFKYNIKQHLTLHIFGHNKNLIEIYKNGLTNNNGHFLYANHRHKIYSKVVWNKAIKIYFSEI